MLVNLNVDNLSKANGFTQMVPISKDVSIITSQKVMVNGILQMEMLLMVYIHKLKELMQNQMQ